MFRMFYGTVGFLNYPSIGNWNFSKIIDASGVISYNSNFYEIVYNIGTSDISGNRRAAKFNTFLTNLNANATVGKNLFLGYTGVKNALPLTNPAYLALTNNKKMRITFTDEPPPPPRDAVNEVVASKYNSPLRISTDKNVIPGLQKIEIPRVRIENVY
jgi:hypothetical protein